MCAPGWLHHGAADSPLSTRSPLTVPSSPRPPRRQLSRLIFRLICRLSPRSPAAEHSDGPPARPRIAYLITSSEVGGAQAHVASLIQGLAGRIAAIVLAGGEGPLFATAAALRAETRKLPRLDNALSPLRALTCLRELMKALRAARPDLIHAHSGKAGALGRVAGWLLGIPVVYTVHGFGFKAAAPWRQRTAARLAESLLAPLTTRLICVADAERQLAARLPLDPAVVRVVPNGVPDTAERARPGAPLRRIVMIARFAHPKRPDLLIRAFAQCLQQDPERFANCELVIAGEGPYRAAMRDLADTLVPGRVVLPGNVDTVPALLASAQVFVLASDHEGFPLSILEAMRAGLPVVATDLPGIREQLDGGRCGMLCVPGDVPALAAALRALAGDPMRRASLGEAGRQRWAMHYGVEAMAEATWQVYREAMPAGRTAGVAA